VKTNLRSIIREEVWPESVPIVAMLCALLSILVLLPQLLISKIIHCAFHKITLNIYLVNGQILCINVNLCVCKMQSVCLLTVYLVTPWTITHVTYTELSRRCDSKAISRVIGRPGLKKCSSDSPTWAHSHKKISL
jgi:hypothetical protein